MRNAAAPSWTVAVGLCGFSMSMKTYGSHFPVVEIQNTFYEPPGDATLRKWRAVTGRRVPVPGQLHAGSKEHRAQAEVPDRKLSESRDWAPSYDGHAT
jgi:hypothetical protein